MLENLLLKVSTSSRNPIKRVAMSSISFVKGYKTVEMYKRKIDNKIVVVEQGNK
jgi:hypothetical protein